MTTFKDNEGRDWQIDITVDAIKRVKGLLDVNLAEINAPGSAEGGGVPLMTRIETDIMLLCDVIYALCKPQADSHNVSDEQFGAALGGDAIAAAHDAFWRELADFFRKVRRGDVAQAIDKQIELVHAAVDRATTAINSVNVDEAVEEAFGSQSTNSPASSASTPGR
ncbi:MAG: hypothetical protein GC159_17375 [Phycisphaera sp.]|nr:hypothetical protein [Phycisphaera sp.]